jgi:hypothetical protein
MKRLLALMMLLPFLTQAQTVNSNVTQRNLGQTICVPNWSATVRPSTSYTRRIKLAQLKAKGIPSVDAPLYELDHIVPISSGGAPRDPNNLMLQLWTDPVNGAKPKDVKEAAVHRKICNGSMTLAQGQACFLTDWKTCPSK